MAGSCVNSIFHLLRNLHKIYIPTNSVQGFSFLHIFASQHLLFVFFLMIAFWQVRSDISLWFWFAFSWWLVMLSNFSFFFFLMLSNFSCAYWSLACILWRNVYSVLLLIFWLGCLALILSCMRCLHMLAINPLQIVSFESIYSHSVGYFLFY